MFIVSGLYLLFIFWRYSSLYTTCYYTPNGDAWYFSVKQSISWETQINVHHVIIHDFSNLNKVSSYKHHQRPLTFTSISWYKLQYRNISIISGYLRSSIIVNQNRAIYKTIHFPFNSSVFTYSQYLPLPAWIKQD